LWNPQVGYFTKSKEDIHVAPNKYRRFVISNLLKDNLSNAKWVIDLAAGRGADLHRYQEIGVENILCIDIDSSAIAELIRRKFEYTAAKKRVTKVVAGYDAIHGLEFDKIIEKTDVRSLTVYTLIADLKEPHSKLFQKVYEFAINQDMIDGIVCNFALHYLCDTIEHIRNILQFVALMLKTGGVFIFTVMNGRKVFDLLKDYKTGGIWKSEQDNVTKYAICKKYTGDKLSASGQQISVLMPFSNEMYDEPLANIDTIIDEAKKLGFVFELNESFASFSDKFAKTNKTLFDRLTPDDKKYIDLYSYVTLRLVKKK
jgi:SAM-dependent methyltransferase